MAKTLGKEHEAEKEPGKQFGKVYSAGIYARLSVDSGERKNESIEAQIAIAKEFAGRQTDMEIYGVYTDIGKTGTTFEREGFERMMRDVRARRIDCIIVKDLSRFGRNHIETGNYIEKIFPFMGMRFIAVTDNFDSMNLSGKGEAMSVNLKNLVNEMYARDIAAKVKTGKRAKWAQGSYTGGIPPYGYRAEWIDGKKRLFIQEGASDIVKKMYEMFLSGSNMKEIAVWLYENKVARPMEYRRTGQVYCRDGEKLEQWPSATVKMILTSPVYMGCLVQGCACGKDYMLRRRQDIDSGDWSIREHTHEAIVSEEIFFEAAGKFEKSSKYGNKSGYSKKVPPEEDIFAGILYCGDCGSKMKRVMSVKEFSSKGKVRIYGYKCSKADRIDGLKCPGKNITLAALTEVVRETVRREFILSNLQPENLAELNRREVQARKAEWNRRFAMAQRQLEGIAEAGSGQYLKYRMGKMSEGEFKRAKEENDKKADTLREESRAIEEKLREIDSEAAKKERFLSALAAGGGRDKLTAEIVRMLFERIEVYSGHRVKVGFGFGRSAALDNGIQV
ncbi:MAG: recombinase family protein [Clostridium sp.]|nr:recombinase family protein [Clostridium sp.]